MRQLSVFWTSGFPGFFIFIILWLHLFSVHESLAQSSPYRHYTVEEGLSSNTVYDIVQDDRGFIWFATSAGVSRFDGNNFVRYAIEDGLGDNDVLKLFKDSGGRLWLSGFNSTLTIIHNDSIRNTSNDPLLRSLSSDFFYKYIYEAKPGMLLFSNMRTSSFIFTYPESIEYRNPRSCVIFDTKDGFLDINDTIRVLADGAEDTLLYHPGNPVFAWHVHKDSLLFMCTVDGIIKMDRNRKASLIRIPKNLISSYMELYVDPDQGIWINSANRGVVYFPQIRGRYTEHKTYFGNMNITSVFCDSERNMWFSSHGNGVFMMTGNFSSVVSYTVADGLVDNEANSIYLDSKNRLWIGHRNALVEVISEGKFIRSKLHDDQLSVDRVLRFAEHPDGYIYAASDAGLFQMNLTGDSIRIRRQVFYPNILKRNKSYRHALKDIRLDRDSTLLAVTIESIQRITKENIRNPDTTAICLDFPVHRYYAVCTDPDGGFWFSDVDGLNYYSNGKTENFSKIHPLLSRRISDLAMIGNRLLISVEGYGLLILNRDNSIVHLTSSNGLLSNHCGRIFVRNNTAFICTNKGVNYLTFSKEAKPVLLKITTADGLLSNQVNDVFADDNILYAASQRGVSLLKLNQIGSGRQSTPRIYIMNVSWQGQNIPVKTAAPQEFDNGNIKFEFLSPFFAFPEGVRYQYRLNDQPWMDIPTGAMEFNALTPGDYLFSVRARHLDSPWSQPSSYMFVIPQPYYSAWWFYAILLFAALLATGFVYYRKTKRLRREQQVKIDYEQKINRLQGQSLQAMMNPHFIFNSLNAIQQLVNSGQISNAGQYLSRFSRMMRMNLQTINEDQISVREELERLKLYLDTEKLRLRERLSYEIEVAEDIDTDDISIPTMIIQPFLENAIWHGIMPLEHGGIVKLRIEKYDHNLKIIVDDNGIGYLEASRKHTDRKGKTNFGINLASRRLELISLKSGKKTDLVLFDKSEAGGRGTTVTIVIPVSGE